MKHKVCKVGDVFLSHSVQQGLGLNLLLPCPDHRRRAMGIVRAEIADFMSALALETNPDIRLDVLDEMPDVNGSIHVELGDISLRDASSRTQGGPELSHQRFI